MMLNLEIGNPESGNPDSGNPKTGVALRKVEITPGAAPGQYTVLLNGTVIQADARMLEPGVLSLLLGARAYRCILQTGPEGPAVVVEGRQYPYRIDDPRSLRSRRARAQVADGVLPVKASMPGRVVRVLVEAGAEVEAQQGLLVIEAMKMQNELKAPKAGRVIEIRVAPGEAVTSGQVLAMVE